MGWSTHPKGKSVSGQQFLRDCDKLWPVERVFNIRWTWKWSIDFTLTLVRVFQLCLILETVQMRKHSVSSRSPVPHAFCVCNYLGMCAVRRGMSWWNDFLYDSSLSNSHNFVLVSLNLLKRGRYVSIFLSSFIIEIGNSNWWFDCLVCIFTIRTKYTMSAITIVTISLDDSIHVFMSNVTNCMWWQPWCDPNSRLAYKRHQ